MAVVRMTGRVNRPLALLGAGLVWVGMKLCGKAATVKPVPIKEPTRSSWLIDWRRRKLRA